VQYTPTKYISYLLFVFTLFGFSQQSEVEELQQAVDDNVSKTLAQELPVDSVKIYPLRVRKEYNAQKAWVDSLYNKMTLKEKVGQLFMVDVFSSKSKKETDKIKKLIADYNIGGIIYSKGGPGRQAILNNEYQALSKIPLLIGMDAEWGLAMRLDSTKAFPWNMTGYAKRRRTV